MRHQLNFMTKLTDRLYDRPVRGQGVTHPVQPLADCAVSCPEFSDPQRPARATCGLELSTGLVGAIPNRVQLLLGPRHRSRSMLNHLHLQVLAIHSGAVH